MLRRRMVRRSAVALCLTLALASLLAPAVSAQTGQGSTAEACREADASGLLDLLGVTRGECLNIDRPSFEVNPIANARNAGLCAVDFYVGDQTKGECMRDVASTHVPFSASLVETVDPYGPVSGSGTASRMNRVTMTGEIYAIDLYQYPATFTFYVASTLEGANGDELFIDEHLTFTDTDEPPIGEHFTASGVLGITGGSGRFAAAHGIAQITGTCTSPVGVPYAICTVEWNGTIGF